MEMGFKEIEKCRICGSKELQEVLTLDPQFVSATFVETNKNNTLADVKIPMTMVICLNNDCSLVQLKETTKPELLYTNYFYRTSANQMMQDETVKQSGPPPPGPVRTRQQEPPMRPGQMAFTENPVSRPDINVARGNSMPTGSNNYASASTSTKRPEMKGPSNIDSILSGLKTKNINLQDEKTNDTGSVISVTSLNELKDEKLPKGTTRRRQKSDKNTISLDI